MILLPQRLIWLCAAVIGAIGVSGCAPSFDDAINPIALKGANEGVVFLKITYAGKPCRLGNVALATEPSPGRYVLHSSPTLGGINSAGFNSRQLPLPSGTYHIGYVQCALDDATRTVVLGETDGAIQIGNPQQSFAHFTIAAGEVVNLGQLNLVPTDYLENSATISITDIDANAMERLKSGVPKLSSMMVSRLMSATDPGRSHKITWVQAIGG